MQESKQVRSIGAGKVAAEFGPMYLRIEAWSDNRPDSELARAGAEIGFSALEEVAVDFARFKAVRKSQRPEDRGQVWSRMVKGTQALNEPDLTPMAAVAGSIADLVADQLKAMGANKAIVDNGGDLAVRLSPGHIAWVGLQPDLQQAKLSHLLRLNADKSAWGVATSGLGGRSLTKGIASAVTTVACSAALADAASTAIANACRVQDRRVTMVPAQCINPDSDLGEDLITLSVQDLEETLWTKALNRGLQKAETFCEMGLLRGACCVVGPFCASTKAFYVLTGSSKIG